VRRLFLARVEQPELAQLGELWERMLTAPARDLTATD
jgi:hypothetical protein